MARVRFLSVASLLLTSGLLGCSGGDKQAPATVSGSLSYNGQPVKAGTMQFHTADGVPYSAQIAPDGTYTATDLPTGEMVVTVETESINPNKAAPKGGDAARRMKMQVQQPAPGTTTAGDLYVKIPRKYADPKSSPLKVTLERGRQTYDFTLTD